MVDHILKTDPEMHYLVWIQEKSFDFRKNDRDFKKGDYLFLVSYDRAKGIQYDEPVLCLKITHVLKDSYGMPEGYAGLSFRRDCSYYSQDCKQQFWDAVEKGGK